MANWFIEGYWDGESVLRRMPVTRSPFQIGRQKGLDLTVMSGDVSRIHAELFEEASRYFVRDLDSTNGTFVNHTAIQGEKQLRNGDVIHVANIEFRVILPEPTRTTTIDTGATTTMDALSSLLATGASELRDMIAGKQIRPAFQSIVNAGTHEVFAWEVLGRGVHPELPSSPGELFWIAESINEEVALSELMRDEGIRLASEQVAGSQLFLNTHPSEMRDRERLLESLEWIKKAAPSLRLVLEIHEQGVTDIEAMQQLKGDLKNMDIQLAYDDFGAGQGRLLELLEATPDYLKFDMAFIRNIDKASEAKLKMLETLVTLTKSMGIKALAEGASKASEVNVCEEIGFELIQGYFFGKPNFLMKP